MGEKIENSTSLLEGREGEDDKSHQMGGSMGISGGG
jgi:hypothetical protein